MDAINSKTRELRSLGIRMTVQMAVHLLNPGSSIRKTVGLAFKREVSKKKFNLAASERLLSPFEQKLSVAAIGFFFFFGTSGWISVKPYFHSNEIVCCLNTTTNFP
jgi:hypothetical protein